MATKYSFDLEPKILELYPNLTSSEVTTIATNIVNSSDPLVDPVKNLRSSIIEVSIASGISLGN